MLEELKIRLFGRQPIPAISTGTLEKIIQRDYNGSIEEVKYKLKAITSDTLKGKNRISAAILKLAKGDINKIDQYIDMYKNDFREVLANAEFPITKRSGFGENNKIKIRTSYLTDWKNYTDWLNKY